MATAYFHVIIIAPCSTFGFGMNITRQRIHIFFQPHGENIPSLLSASIVHLGATLSLVKDNQPLSFSHICCRGVAARAGSVYLIYSMDQKLGQKEGLQEISTDHWKEYSTAWSTPSPPQPTYCVGRAGPPPHNQRLSSMVTEQGLP